MQFKGPLDSTTEHRIQLCDSVLKSPARLKALNDTGLMDSGQEHDFDRLAHLAAKILDVPLTIISLVGDKKQFFKAGFGLPSPYDVNREVSIDDSICRYTLYNEPIIAADAKTDPLLKNHPTTAPWGIGAFIAIPMRNRDGHVLGAFCAVDVKARPWSDQDILVLRELTASVMTEIELRVQIRELKAERDLRETFVMALSHDLRNPLSIAKMGAEMLSDANSSEEDRTVFTQLISDNIDRADNMIQDLLTASRIKAGEVIPLDKTSGDMVQVIQSTVDSLKRIHKKEFVLETDGPIEGHWDSDRVRRIVENLATNAVKYGDANKKITVALKHYDQGIEISVNNHGPKLSEKELRSFFKLFHRSESALSSTEKGWGIGLTVVRGLALEMGGRFP